MERLTKRIVLDKGTDEEREVFVLDNDKIKPWQFSDLINKIAEYEEAEEQRLRDIDCLKRKVKTAQEAVDLFNKLKTALDYINTIELDKHMPPNWIGAISAALSNGDSEFYKQLETLQALKERGNQ